MLNSSVAAICVHEDVASKFTVARLRFFPI
jgi:hypothetical protein